MQQSQHGKASWKYGLCLPYIYSPAMDEAGLGLVTLVEARHTIRYDTIRYDTIRWISVRSKVKYTYTSTCIAHFYTKHLKYAQIWITQFYHACLCSPAAEHHRPLAGRAYSFYRPTEGRRLSRPGWLVKYRNKVPPPGVEPGHGHPSQY